jgi:hypothetical protein
MKALLWSLTALILQGVQPLPAQAALPSYRIDLFDAAPTGFTFGPASMNDRGAIAGLATDNSTFQQQLALYRGGHFALLGALDGLGSFSDLREVNNRGEVVGHVFRAEGVRPFIYSHGQLSLLPLPEDARGQARVLDINNAGHAVGYTQEEGQLQRAFFYDGHQSRYLDELLPPGTVLGALNDRDEMAGGRSDNHPLLLRHGVVTTLPALPVEMPIGDEFGLQAFTLNNAGQLFVGYSINRDKDANDEWGAYVYDSGRYNLVSGGNYFGVDMNEKGRAVGDFFDESGDPMIYGANLYANGQFATLDSLKRPSDVPWQLLQTYAIDNRGRILGLGSIADNVYRFFLATPVPEPGTLSLMLAGAMLLAAASHRRRPR